MKRSPLPPGRWHRLDARLRAAVLARDRGCAGRASVPSVACEGALDVHHTIPRGLGGTTRPDRLEDLVALCRAHHRWVHSHPKLARDLGLLRSA